MSLRDAAIRLSLRGGSFMGGLDELGRKTESVARKMGAALKRAGTEGLKGLKSGLSEGFGQLKTALGAAGGIAGAFSVGSALTEAQDLREIYKSIAFSIRAGSGEAKHYSEVQAEVEA